MEKPIRVTTEMDSETPSSCPLRVKTAVTELITKETQRMAVELRTKFLVIKSITIREKRMEMIIPWITFLTNMTSVGIKTQTHPD